MLIRIFIVQQQLNVHQTRSVLELFTVAKYKGGQSTVPCQRDRSKRISKHDTYTYTSTNITKQKKQKTESVR